MRKKITHIVLVVWLLVICCHIQCAKAQLFGGKLREPSIFDPSGIPTGSGNFTGRVCFDIAEDNDDLNGCGTLSGRTPNRDNFNVAGTRAQTYTFTPSGTVSNVRFYYLNTNGEVITSVSGGNPGNNITTPQTATFYYNQDLSSDNPGSAPYNGLAYGLTSSNPLIAILYVVYNDGATGGGTDRQLNITAYVKDCACCGAFVATGVWKQFYCYNLGSYDQTTDPLTPAWQNNGGYYQWGRLPDCGQCWGVIDNSLYAQTGLASPNVVGAAGPSNGDPSGENIGYVANWCQIYASSYSWADSVKTAYDPCSPGYRVPTHTQLEGLRTKNPHTSTGCWDGSCPLYTTAYYFGPQLMLPAADYIRYNYGNITGHGHLGRYWSSTLAPYSADRAWYIHFDDTFLTPNYFNRRNGLSVRCIAE